MRRAECKNVLASGWHGWTGYVVRCQYLLGRVLSGRVATVAPHEDSDF